MITPESPLSTFFCLFRIRLRVLPNGLDIVDKVDFEDEWAEL